jgi:hypothetical protein
MGPAHVENDWRVLSFYRALVFGMKLNCNLPIHKLEPLTPPFLGLIALLDLLSSLKNLNSSSICLLACYWCFLCSLRFYIWWRWNVVEMKLNEVFPQTMYVYRLWILMFLSIQVVLNFERLGVAQLWIASKALKWKGAL